MERPLIFLDRYVKSSGTGRERAAEILRRELACEMRSIEIRAAPSGKPLLWGADYHVAIAHSGDTIAVYVGHEDAGIDIERMKSRKNIPEIAALLFSPAEAARCAEGGATGLARFYRAWTEREATLKRYGFGVLDSLPRGSPDPRETRHWRISSAVGSEKPLGAAKEYILCLSAPKETLERIEIRILDDSGLDPASLTFLAPERGDY
jgi:hypothetical protein